CGFVSFFPALLLAPVPSPQPEIDCEQDHQSRGQNEKPFLLPDPVFLLFLFLCHALLLLNHTTNPPISTTAGMPNIISMLNSPACWTVLYSTPRLFASMDRFCTPSKFAETAFMKICVFSSLGKVSVIDCSFSLAADITVRR